MGDKVVRVKSTDALVEELFRIYETDLRKAGLNPVAGDEVHIVFRMIDHVVSTRILEAFERIGIEGRSPRTKKRMSDAATRRIRSTED